MSPLAPLEEAADLLADAAAALEILRLGDVLESPAVISKAHRLLPAAMALLTYAALLAAAAPGWHQLLPLLPLALLLDDLRRRRRALAQAAAARHGRPRPPP